MLSRQRNQPPSMTRAHSREIRFPFRRKQSGAASRVPGEGRLGMDLRGQPGKQRDAFEAPAHAAPRPRLLPSRRSTPAATAHPGRRILPSPAVTLLLMAQVAIIVAAGWALTSPVWEVRHIAVEGTQDQTLIRAVESLPLTGCNIFRCDLADRARHVEALPAVASADVQAVFPDTLAIVVTPRRPTLLLRTTTGAFVIADDGVVLGLAASDPAWNATSLPALDDPGAALAGGTPPVVGARLDASLVKLAAQLRSGVHGALGDAWTLRYGGDGFTATGPDGTLVRFGTTRDVASATGSDLSVATLGGTPDAAALSRGADAQLTELRAVLKLLATRGERATLIDLRWTGHPYLRLAG